MEDRRVPPRARQQQSAPPAEGRPVSEGTSVSKSPPVSKDISVSKGIPQSAPVNWLRAFQAHGVDLSPGATGEQAIGECPFCQRERKWYASPVTGLWQCFICGAKGNVASFLQQLHTSGQESTQREQLKELAENRGLLNTDTLAKWEVVQSPINGEWLVPGYNLAGKITQLYRYVQLRDSEKRVLLATPDLPQAIYGVNLYDLKKPYVYVCEGPWDAMMLWEVLSSVKQTEDGLELTGEEAASLLAQVNILAVPGCLVFRPEWYPLFAGKRVYLLYDNDHPKLVNGKPILGGGITGMRRAAGVLSQFSPAPVEVHYLCWGESGLDHNSELRSGYDIRDWFSSESSEVGRASILPDLLAKIVPIPDDWIVGRTATTVAKGGVRLQPGQCTSWEELINACRKALNWTEGLDRGLSCIMASIISVKSNGDPLWLKLIGPPSTGKSTLAEAVSVADKYVYALSTLTGFHSGWKTDRIGEEDHGLLPKIADKTFIVKDADTILSAANKDKILSEARDLYDNVCRTHYLHGVSRTYDDIRTTIILSGTKSLHALDGSELGERFVDVVIMDTIDPELEADVCRRKIYTAWKTAGTFANGKAETMTSPEMAEMKRLTGGYVCYLRENAQDLICKVISNPPTLTLVDELSDIGRFVAYIRARPSKRQDEGDDREFAARLVSQFTRLAICLTAVLGKDTVDQEVMRRVRQTALDTARGRTLEICRHIYPRQAKGVSISDLALHCNSTEDRKKRMLRFLRKIGATEAFRKVIKGQNGSEVTSSQVKWRLTQPMLRLWESVVVKLSS